MEATQTTGRTYTSTLTGDGERIPVEIPTRLPVEEWAVEMDNQPLAFRGERQPIRLDTPYQEWAAEQSARYIRNRLYQNNAAQWLRQTVEALADQADFTAAETLRDLCETYDRKARGL